MQMQLKCNMEWMLIALFVDSLKTSLIRSMAAGHALSLHQMVELVLCNLSRVVKKRPKSSKVNSSLWKTHLSESQFRVCPNQVIIDI